MSPMFDRLNTPRRRATRQLARARLLLGWGIKQGVHPNASLVMAILMALIHIPQGMSQNATLKPEETISIVYGYVTHPTSRAGKTAICPQASCAASHPIST